MSEPDLTSDYEVYEPDWDDAYAFEIEFEDGVNIDFIEELGMGEMRPRLWRVEPGEKLSYHYHEEQEELFYVVKGTGQMLVGEDEELVKVPEGGFIKPGGRTPRSLRNDTDEAVVWLLSAHRPSSRACSGTSTTRRAGPQRPASSSTYRSCSEPDDHTAHLGTGHPRARTLISDESNVLP